MTDSDKNGGPVTLRAWRRHRKLSQAALGEAVNTNANMIGYLETGERALTVLWMRKLSRVLNVRPGILIDDEPGDNRSVPSERELAGMLKRAMLELPPGVSYEDFPQAVASSLHERLAQYQDAGGYLDSRDEESGIGTTAQSDLPTTLDELAE